MKTRLLPIVIIGLAPEAHADPGPLPEMNITTAAAVLELRLDDPWNRAWVLQTAGSLSQGAWQDAVVWKPHNGHLSHRFQPGAGRSFFRVREYTGETFASTTATALVLPAQPFNYANPQLPPHFLAPVITGQNNTPANNPTTDSGALLGRVLFYDKRLSRNQTLSCSSCHQQAHGFSDPARFSTGFDGGLTGRNSMGLANARYYARRSFFWDERAVTLEAQVLEPIQNEVEMGMTLPELEARLSAEPFYRELFATAFGSETITSARISRALAQFVRSIVSTRTKYDTGVATNFSNFTAQENQGRQIFNSPALGNCAACHGTDNFVPGNNIFNNGLENPYLDKGLGAITGLAADEGKFKVPSLRNIPLTAPYMHDGRFATLEEVVEFYNSGVVNHPNLSPPLRNPPPAPPTPRRLNLTAGQKAALAAFLRTLTDEKTATNPMWSDPFNYEP